MTITRIIHKRLLKLAEAAEYLGISERKLEYLTAQGAINQTRLPDTKKRLYDVMDLDELIELSKNNCQIKSV
jgi:excisionase family DNA binding protein